MWRRCLWRTGVWMGWRRLRWNRGGTLSTWIWARRWSVDGGAIGGGLSSDAPRLLGKGEGCRPGGVVGVPWVRHEAAADPQGCEARGRLSRRDARDRFDRRCLLFDVAGAFRDQPRRYRPRGRPGAFRDVTGVSRVSGGCVGVYNRGTGLTSIDNASRRVATGRWRPPSSSNTKRRLPRRAALRRSLSRKTEKRCLV